MTDVHLGLIAPNYGPGLKPDNLLEAATTAERAGFDSVWVTDHIAVPKELAPVYGEITEALVTLAYLAARTSSIKLGASALGSESVSRSLGRRFALSSMTLWQ
jgi:alkanesulfonate monooxygenase SsuD/methylene tetrahydromethanopterin reductase-like flavin-dependent oxidoreductase (luciferase family)